MHHQRIIAIGPKTMNANIYSDRSSSAYVRTHPTISNKQRCEYPDTIPRVRYRISYESMLLLLMTNYYPSPMRTRGESCARQRCVSSLRSSRHGDPMIEMSHLLPYQLLLPISHHGCRLTLLVGRHIANKKFLALLCPLYYHPPHYSQVEDEG